MRCRAKQNIIITIFIIILLIPTYIAVSSYFAGYSDSFEITVLNEAYNEIMIPQKDIKNTASLILNAGSKLIAADKSMISLPSKYYLITVKENGIVLSSMRWYMIAQKNSDSYVEDANGNIYIIKYKHVKKLLSKGFAYHFYENSSLPVLSINGVDEILPSKGIWSYRTINGSMLNTPYASNKNINSYPINKTAKLSFSSPPQKCEIKVYKDKDLLGKYSSLEDLPELENGLKIKIDAKWKTKNYEGNAKYEFLTKDWSPPVYTLQSTTINSGEFFCVKVANVASPHKIEFSSIPEIYAKPVFYGDVALIPIKKELSAPCNYTFIFKYGEDTQQFSVNVESRAIRDDKICDVSCYPTDSDLERIGELFTAVTQRSENKIHFSEGFLDYAPSESGSTRIAEVFYGFGHTVVPINGAEPYRIDGVIYIFPECAEIPSVCRGTVLCAGNDPILGLYAAVDHGAGLLTWYCNLGAVHVNVGDEVNTGDSIGVSGNVGVDDINGVYLITTAGGIPVSPYPLQDE